MKRAETISQDGKYRYTLTRIWDDEKPNLMFIMLNPSTANGLEDDNTIRRCIGFAKSWGYGGFYVCNLFAYRSTDPEQLLKVDNPFGDKNLWYIKQIEEKVETVVLAWGNEKIVDHFYMRNNLSAVGTLPIAPYKLHYLELSKGGTCKHPLYLPKKLSLKKLYE